MKTIERRVTDLEQRLEDQTCSGRLLRNPATNAMLESALSKAGTTVFEQVSIYGGAHAFLKAVAARIRTIQSNREEARK